ncbi:MAG: copper chaperone [Thermomicrobiales bacterium]|nr:MAG: copper chaperone [Thermomicrobiales bacterium]
MTTTKLTVPDMSCAHCEHTIRETLSPLPGIEQVNIDLPSKTVTVTYDSSQTGVDQMSAALAEEDYPVAAVEDVLAA